MLINAKIGKHAYLLDRPHLPLQPEFEDNEVMMDDNDPNSAATRMAAEAAEAEAARNRPPRVPQIRTQAEQMAFLVSTIQGMENVGALKTGVPSAPDLCTGAKSP